MSVNAPWWGVPVVAGSFLIIGALLGFLFNWVLEGRKASRAEAIRWDADLRKYAAELIECVYELRKEGMYRRAFYAGFISSVNHELDRMSAEDYAKAIPEGTSRADYIKSESRGIDWKDQTLKATAERVEALWDRIRSIQAHLRLIAPPAVQDALEPLLEFTWNAASTQSILDNPLTQPDGYAEAMDKLVDAIREHLRVDPLGHK